MAQKTDDKTSDIPERLYDTTTRSTYKRLRFFGKGGFAKCYEIVDVETNNVYAGKIVSKKLMLIHNQKEKMSQEITIHKSLNHENIVKFHSFFEDSFNIYIVLELCKKRRERAHEDVSKLGSTHTLWDFEQLIGEMADCQKKRAENNRRKQFVFA